jgi:hypothetical protein
MIELTPESRQLRDEYLRQVRAYVSASGKADAQDVLRDIEEHLDRELAAAEQPVSGPALKEVLDRLGSPQQWIPAEDMPWWRRAILRARVGPEDWRLAYATFGLLLAGVLFGWIFSDTYTWGRGSRHSFNEGAFNFFLLASFVLARATLASVGPGGLVPGQKWLVYPPLVIIYPLLAAAIIAWASLAAGGIAYAVTHDSVRQHDAMTEQHMTSTARATTPSPPPVSSDYQKTKVLAVTGLAGAMAGGVWLIVLGLLLRSRGRLAQIIFRPFLDRGLRKIARAVLLLGVVLLVLGGALLAITA